MNARALLFVLFSLLFTAPLQAAVSPVPIVTLDKVDLPKVTLRISNPDMTRECRIWAQGTSWEEQTKWFSVRTTAGGKIVELHPNVRIYTVNYAKVQSIPAGGSATFQYDLSDGSREGWNLPEDFAPGNWDFQIQAHLDIPRELVAHYSGVFTGKVPSSWCDAKGQEVEPAGKPAPDPDETAIESRTDFPWKRLTASLKEWDAATLTDHKTLDDFFRADFPWDHIQGHYDLTGGVGGASILQILLPDQSVLRFQFRVQHPPLAKLFYQKKGKRSHYMLLDIKPILKLTAAEQVAHISLHRSVSPSSVLFARAFGTDGRFDKEATERLWH